MSILDEMIQKCVDLKHWGLHDQEWGCEACDCHLVKGSDPSTGSFYNVFGMVRHVDFKTKKSTYDNYEQVVFAVCKVCLDG